MARRSPSLVSELHVLILRKMQKTMSRFRERDDRQTWDFWGRAEPHRVSSRARGLSGQLEWPVVWVFPWRATFHSSFTAFLSDLGSSWWTQKVLEHPGESRGLTSRKPQLTLVGGRLRMEVLCATEVRDNHLVITFKNKNIETATAKEHGLEHRFQNSASWIRLTPFPCEG